MNASGMLDRVDARELGTRLKAARTSAEVTQEVAAERIGAARTTIVAIEHGDRRLGGGELLALCELYGVSVGSMLRAGAVQVDLAPQFRRAGQAEADPAASEATRLLGSGEADTLLQALPPAILIEQRALAEVLRDPSRNLPVRDKRALLVERQLLQVRQLAGDAIESFLPLMTGKRRSSPAPSTLAPSRCWTSARRGESPANGSPRWPSPARPGCSAPCWSSGGWMSVASGLCCSRRCKRPVCPCRAKRSIGSLDCSA
jgi:DNA-binding XRE family transcriptional regulator